MVRRLAPFIACAVLLAAGIARADAVPPPPTNCPPGALGGTSHMGPYCGPADCTSDADCHEGQRCAYYPLCVQHSQSNSPRGMSYSAAVDGPCKGGACANGFTCEASNHCVPKGVGAPPSSTAPAGSSPPDTTGTTAPPDTTGAPADSTTVTWAAPPPVPPPSNRCGCTTPGAAGAAGASFAGLAVVALFASRRRRTRQ